MCYSIDINELEKDFQLRKNTHEKGLNLLLDYNTDRQTIDLNYDDEKGHTISEVFSDDTSIEKVNGNDEALIYFSYLGQQFCCVHLFYYLIFIIYFSASFYVWWWYLLITIC